MSACLSTLTQMTAAREEQTDNDTSTGQSRRLHGHQADPITGIKPQPPLAHLSQADSRQPTCQRLPHLHRTQTSLPPAALSADAGEARQKLTSQPHRAGSVRPFLMNPMPSTLPHRVYKFRCCADDIILRIQAENVAILLPTNFSFFKCFTY